MATNCPSLSPNQRFIDQTITGRVADGNYSLTVPDQGITLVFSFTGYATQEIAPGNRSNPDIVLISNDKTLS